MNITQELNAMPILRDYKCVRCGYEDERFEKQEVFCTRCGGEMTIQVSAPKLGNMDSLGRSVKSKYNPNLPKA